MSAETFFFRPRKRRAARFGKYAGLVTVLHTREDGSRLVLRDDQRFTAFADEIRVLAKPIHGSEQNYRIGDDGWPVASKP